jgi:hypothetical protein
MTGLDISAPLLAATLQGLRGQIDDITYLVRRPACVRHLAIIAGGTPDREEDGEARA